MTLFAFLMCCGRSRLKKEILDCGAGGEYPPLHVFHALGYQTHGIDISEERVRKARVFCEKKGIDCGIQRGDMRHLSFDDSSISFVYSFDTIFHMPKREISIAMKEMKRVLKKNGLLYVNFLSTDDSKFGEGQQVGAGEFLQSEFGEKSLHSYYEDDEPDRYFNDLDVLVKEKRVMRFVVEGKERVAVTLDYIARKR